MKLEEIMELYQDIEFTIATGFDDAILGVCYDFTEHPKIIYSVRKCIEILMKQFEKESESVRYDMAMEYFTYNVSGAYMGYATPIWCWDIN